MPTHEPYEPDAWAKVASGVVIVFLLVIAVGVLFKLAKWAWS